MFDDVWLSAFGSQLSARGQDFLYYVVYLVV